MNKSSLYAPLMRDRADCFFIEFPLIVWPIRSNPCRLYKYNDCGVKSYFRVQKESRKDRCRSTSDP